MAADNRRCDDRIIQNNGKAVTNILLGIISENTRSFQIKAKGNNGFAGLLIKARLGINQIFSGDNRPFRNHNWLGWIVICIIQYEPYRSTSALLQHILRVNGFINIAEGQFGSFANHIFQSLGVIKARHLNNDTVVALTLYNWLSGSQFVHTATNDFYRLRNR